MEKAKRFLLVEDDTDDQEVFIEALQEIDPTLICITAINGEEALSILEGSSKRLPDYIFLDLNMPIMNGKEFLKTVKNNSLYKNIPVIIYTTSQQEKDEKETARFGASYYLTKPTSLAELKTEIQQVMTMNTFKDSGLNLK